MSKNGQFLIGSVLERHPSGPALPPKPVTSSSHGFPVVQHRSKSAFARSREEARKSTQTSKISRPQAPPTVVPSQSTAADGAEVEKSTTDDWRQQISKENEIRVASMTDEEREAEKREILERFGADIGDVLKRARLAREKNPTKVRWPTQKSRPPPPSFGNDQGETLKNLPEGELIFYCKYVSMVSLNVRQFRYLRMNLRHQG